MRSFPLDCQRHIPVRIEELISLKLHLTSGTQNISHSFSEGEISLTVGTVRSDREPRTRSI